MDFRNRWKFFLSGKSLRLLPYSEGQSELQMMLASLVVENRRLKLDEAQQLDSLIKGVHDAISQLQTETKRRNDTVQAKSQTFQAVSSDEVVGTTPAWEDMKELSTNISSLANQVRLSASDQTLLTSLWFDYRHRRQANVESAHEKTFEWVLDPSSPGKFENWVRSQSGIYWIKGKAGSGKSTLMKFLLNHPQTADLLRSWAGTKKLVTTSFFFWNAGPSLQRSQEGLLRSLLYEILIQCPDLIRTVCTSKLEMFRPFVKEIDPWTREELCHAIGQLKEQSGVRARFCFFIDGLDEYDGDPDHIVSVLESLRNWPDVKLCVSSRPWNEFIDAFGRASDPKLALEDLTRGDIEVYVRDTLEENSRFKALKVKDNRSQVLVQEIVDKAQGVFLWVRLVVKSLLTGLRNADRISDLQRRLRDFPETLEEYFGHMIASIEPIYREQTAQAFKYALEAREPLHLMTYSFLDEEDLDHMIAAPLNPLTRQEITSRQEDMRRRLNGRCKGLLEVAAGNFNTYDELSLGPLVEFLHRTVRDFLLTKDMQSMLGKNLEPDFEPNARICNALVAQLKALDYGALEMKKRVPEALLNQLAFYARQVENGTHIPQSDALDEADRWISRHGNLCDWRSSDFDFLFCLAKGGLHLYVEEKLATTNRLTQSDKSKLLGSLLHNSSHSATVELKSRPELTMIDILLKHGARPNDRYLHSTVWGVFLEFLEGYGFRSPAAVNDIAVVERLLSHGADLQERIVVGEKKFKVSVGGVELRKSQTDIKSAHEVLLKRLGEEKVAELLKRVQRSGIPVPSKTGRGLGRRLRGSLKALLRVSSTTIVDACLL